MGIITLTTDMGLRDHYVAALKANIYRLAPSANVVDISHFVRPFNIVEAAYYVKSVYKDFPDGTVHVLGVNAEPHVNFSNPDENELPTILKWQNQYFVGTDNGIFHLLLEEEEAQGLWSLDDVLSRPDLMNFPTKNILIPAACRLIQSENPTTFASEKQHFKKAVASRPVSEENVLKGTVMHIDQYGNIITNIKKQLFEKQRNGAPFIIYFRQKEYYIDKISTGYNEVPEGEKVAIFNDNDWLEIAINKGTHENGGGAKDLLGLRLRDIIRIEFLPKGSVNNLSQLF
jgi:S-adenosylmethionine hydrolase